jgi:hypothetical protein
MPAVAAGIGKGHDIRSLSPQTYGKGETSMKNALTLCVTLLISSAAAQNAPAQRTSTDVYHVHFVRAAPGKAGALADSLKKPDPKAAMPGHFVVLRHQDGDDWDYAVIEHMGTKATVDAATAAPVPPAERDLRAWHNDTFASGPPWAEFTRAMGIASAPASTAGSVYRVAVYRAAVGHRDGLEKVLRQPAAKTDMIAGTVVLTHLEGGNWQYLVVDRYNSWQDFGTSENNGRAQMAKGTGGWFDMRQHAEFHSDTLTDRIAP